MVLSEIETAPREQLESLQRERLRSTLGLLLGAVPAIRERLHAMGVHSPDDLRSLAELRDLPFTAKPDLREHYPFGLLAVPREQLIRVHASSGTRGKPTVAGYTSHDLETSGQGAGPLHGHDRGAGRGWWCTTPRAMACSPVGWASTRSGSRRSTCKASWRSWVLASRPTAVSSRTACTCRRPAAAGARSPA